MQVLQPYVNIMAKFNNKHEFDPIERDDIGSL